MWTTVRRNDGTLLAPFHVETPDGGHADGVIELRPGDPGYEEHAALAINEEELQGDPEQDALLIARWSALYDANSRKTA
ncbi:hypothetical protein Aple_013570 [Acrocarpospora pleiomorpha]|uniref:Uncharacterized protein n=1 Tax=Acrocarpospora pleiomorpha TaxID=90975 RepID=A0A5M3XCG5_9ACTN|nr:hypothetical protein [Acrocarpospora pleiomorpha]GES18462.1 hypothetical protein Aple_013570 [Acrocarpospora pleiomorpha]